MNNEGAEPNLEGPLRASGRGGGGVRGRAATARGMRAWSRAALGSARLGSAPSSAPCRRAAGASPERRRGGAGRGGQRRAQAGGRQRAGRQAGR